MSAEVVPVEGPVEGPAAAVGGIVWSGRGALERAGALLDDLHEATLAPVTARRPWLRAWIDATPRFTPLVVGVGTPDRLEAAAVLATRPVGPLVSVCDVGRGPSDYQVLPARGAGAARALAGAVADVLDGLRRPWVLRIDQLPDGDPAALALAARLPAAQLVPGVGSPLSALPSACTATSVVTTSGRKALRTAAARLRREDLVMGFTTARSPGDVASALDAAAPVKRARDHEARGWSALDDERGTALWRGTVLALAARGEVEVVSARLGDELAAYAVAFLDRRSYRVWDLRYNPALARYSPGWTLCRHLLERVAADEGLVELDWMNGEEKYKLWMASEVVPHTGLRAWSSSAVRWAEDAPARSRGLLASTAAALGGAAAALVPGLPGV